MAVADKYIAAFWVQVKNILAYRVNVLLKLIRPVLMTVVMASFWVLVFSITGREEIGGFTVASFIVYLLIVRFIASLSPGTAAIWTMNEEIRTGNLVMRLVKPIHYLPWLFSRSLAIPLASGVIGIIAVYVCALTLGVASPNGWFIPLFIVSVVATVLLQYAIYQGLGLLSFWIYEIWSVERLYTSLRTILSGEFVPLTLFSAGVQNILQFLPFASLAFIPAGIFVGLFSMRLAAVLVLTQFFWAMIFWMVASYIYRKGLQKFEAQGG